jgi:hypothetical protein
MSLDLIKHAIDTISAYGNAITALATLALCGLTARYVVLTHQMAKVSQQQSQLLLDQDRREQNRIRSQLWLPAAELKGALVDLLKVADPQTATYDRLKTWHDDQVASLRAAGAGLEDGAIKALLEVQDATEKLHGHYVFALRVMEGSPPGAEAGRLSNEEWRANVTKAVLALDRLERLSRPQTAADLSSRLPTAR